MSQIPAIKLPFEAPAEDIAFHVHYNAYPIQHSHDDFWEFIFINDGEVVHKVNGEPRKLKKNTLCILRPSDYHSFLQPKDTSSMHFNLSVRTSMLKEFFAMLRHEMYEKLSAEKILQYEIPNTNAEAIERAADTIISAERSNKIPTMILYLFCLLQEVFAQMVTTTGIQQQYSACTNKFIRLLNNPANLALGLPQLASMTGYSYSHLNRTFSQETNMSPSQYLKKQRLKYAQELIQYTDTPLSAITFKVGYSNYSHFSDFFKSLTGLTPVEWSKQNKSAHLRDSHTIL